MEQVEYTRMQQYEKTYWWHVGRLEIIRREMARQVAPGPEAPAVLNVGCGTGGTIAMLEAFGKVDNVDVSEDAVAFARGQGFMDVRQVDGVELPFPDGRFGLVTAFDVLEHIREDAAALAEWRRVIAPGGRIVLTVPAYQWLWSGHDVALHHHRRYVRSQLVALARHADLEIVKVSYAIVFSLPLVAAFRLLERVRRRDGGAETSYVPVPGPVNKLFIRLLFAEAALHGRMRFPAGTSLIAVLRKPGGPGTTR